MIASTCIEIAIHRDGWSFVRRESPCLRIQAEAIFLLCSARTGNASETRGRVGCDLTSLQNGKPEPWSAPPLGPPKSFHGLGVSRTLRKRREWLMAGAMAEGGRRPSGATNRRGQRDASDAPNAPLTACILYEARSTKHVLETAVVGIGFDRHGKIAPRHTKIRSCPALTIIRSVRAKRDMR